MTSSISPSSAVLIRPSAPGSRISCAPSRKMPGALPSPTTLRIWSHVTVRESRALNTDSIASAARWAATICPCPVTSIRVPNAIAMASDITPTTVMPIATSASTSVNPASFRITSPTLDSPTLNVFSVAPRRPVPPVGADARRGSEHRQRPRRDDVAGLADEDRRIDRRTRRVGEPAVSREPVGHVPPGHAPAGIAERLGRVGHVVEVDEARVVLERGARQQRRAGRPIHADDLNPVGRHEHDLHGPPLRDRSVARELELALDDSQVGVALQRRRRRLEGNDGDAEDQRDDRDDRQNLGEAEPPLVPKQVLFRSGHAGDWLSKGHTLWVSAANPFRFSILQPHNQGMSKTAYLRN